MVCARQAPDEACGPDASLFDRDPSRSFSSTLSNAIHSTYGPTLHPILFKEQRVSCLYYVRKNNMQETILSSIQESCLVRIEQEHDDYDRRRQSLLQTSILDSAAVLRDIEITRIL